MAGDLNLAAGSRMADDPGAATDRAIGALNRRLAEAAAAVVATLPDASALGGDVREIAHSFNNLLTILHGSTELMRMEGLPAARRERCLNAIEDASDRAVALTRQLQAMAQDAAPKRSDFDLRTRLAAREDIVVATENAATPAVASPCAQWLIHADPHGFDAAILAMTTAIRETAGAGAEAAVSLTLAHTQNDPAGGTPASAGNPHIAITFSVPGLTAINATVMASGLQHSLAAITNLEAGAEQRPGADVAPEWRTVFKFLHQNGGAAQACVVENGGLGLSLVLPGV